jgi:crotonobetainyl-CoA:carnitine CoA-transferase CaiB-like acyl-CoA transferase
MATDTETETALASGCEGECPLEGLKVLDFTMRAVGPFATQILAGLGATVLKVERPGGDPERQTDPPMFNACNQGKHSIVLDAGEPLWRETLDMLIFEADVVVEGFRPGAADNMGIGYERIVADLNPRIVYLSLPGFGSTGPYAQLPAFDTELRAMAGDLHFNRDAAGTPLYASGAPNFDYACAMYGVVGVLTTLLTPRLRPRRIEASILASGLHWTFPRLDPRRPKNLKGRRYVFRTSDDRHMTVTAAEPRAFRKLCDVIGRPELHDGSGRLAVSTQELNEAMDAVVARRPLAEWLERLGRAGVACSAVLEPDEVFAHPQVKHLGVIGLEPQPWSRVPIFGLPTRPLSPPPDPDAHGPAVRAGGWDGLA